MGDPELISFGVAVFFIAAYGVYLHVRNDFAYHNWQDETPESDAAVEPDPGVLSIELQPDR